VAWVQGCPLHCRGCIAPDWIPPEPSRQVHAHQLAAELLADSQVTGFTFSGGEPMAQAAALAEVIRFARRHRDLSLICFTGFRLSQLRARPPGPGVPELLAQTDVLIDGPYVAAKNDDRGLRGSANQQVHFLTGKLTHARTELGAGPRRAEIRLRGDSALLVGVPSHVMAQTFARLPDRGATGPDGGAKR
jgi:anaerobic ribonucleoside-triphosphate reductase activating protein